LLFLRSKPHGLSVLGFPDEIDASQQTIGFFPELGEATWPRLDGYEKHQLPPGQLREDGVLLKPAPVLLLLPTVAGRAITAWIP
jgi:hypothetical protein